MVKSFITFIRQKILRCDNSQMYIVLFFCFLVLVISCIYFVHENTGSDGIDVGVIAYPGMSYDDCKTRLAEEGILQFSIRDNDYVFFQLHRETVLQLKVSSGEGSSGEGEKVVSDMSVVMLSLDDEGGSIVVHEVMLLPVLLKGYLRRIKEMYSNENYSIEELMLYEKLECN